MDLLLGQCHVVGEVAIDLGVPHAQRVHRRIVVADDRHIVRYRHDDHRVFMDKLQFAVHLTHIGITVELHIDRFVRLAVLPYEAVAQPVVRQLHLIAADDLLFKETILIANGAAMSRQTVCSERVDKAGSETTETAVAEPRIRLFLVGVRELQIELLQNLLHRLLNAEVDEIGAQEPTEQKLNGKIVDLLDALLRVLPIRLDPVVRNGLLRRRRNRLVDFGFGQLVETPPKENVRRCDKAALQDLLHRFVRLPCGSYHLFLMCQNVHSFSKAPRVPLFRFLPKAGIPKSKPEAASGF